MSPVRDGGGGYNRPTHVRERNTNKKRAGQKTGKQGAETNGSGGRRGDTGQRCARVSHSGGGGRWRRRPSPAPPPLPPPLLSPKGCGHGPRSHPRRVVEAPAKRHGGTRRWHKTDRRQGGGGTGAGADGAIRGMWQRGGGGARGAVQRRWSSKRGAAASLHARGGDENAGRRVHAGGGGGRRLTEAAGRSAPRRQRGLHGVSPAGVAVTPWGVGRACRAGPGKARRLPQEGCRAAGRAAKRRSGPRCRRLRARLVIKTAFSVQ